ncbi:flagellar basal body-associated FliL family protein [Angustibacter aerolatus]
MSSNVSAVPGGAGGAAGGDPDAAKKKGKGKLVVIALVVVALLGGAGYFVVLKPKSASAATEKKPEPEKGAVVAVDPVNVNLAGGHYLKLGFALQLAKAVKEEPDPSEATDIAIELFSGQSMEKLSEPEGREKMKAKFTKAVEKAYTEKETEAVIDVYLTAFVMQ